MNIEEIFRRKHIWRDFKNKKINPMNKSKKKKTFGESNFSYISSFARVEKYHSARRRVHKESAMEDPMKLIFADNRINI